MDLELLTGILNDAQPPLAGDMLSNLPDRHLSANNGETQPSSSPPRTLMLVNPNQAGAIVSKIEDIFENIAGCILDGNKVLEIRLKSRGRKAATGRDAVTGPIKSLEDDAVRIIKFPSKSPKEAWKFSE